MPESGKTPQEHFIIQRRNLIVVSLCAIFFKAAKLKVTEVDLLGNKTDVGNPHVVVLGLIVFFIYFLWRYYTACRLHEVRGIYRYWQTVKDRREKLVRKAGVIRLRKRVIVVGFLESDYSCVIENKHDTKLDKNVFLRFTPHVYGQDWATVEKNRTLREKVAPVIYSIGQADLFLPKAATLCLIHQREFGEYVLPYLLALWAALELMGLQLTESLIAYAEQIHAYVLG